LKYYTFLKNNGEIGADILNLLLTDKFFSKYKRAGYKIILNVCENKDYKKSVGETTREDYILASDWLKANNLIKTYNLII
jgi:hypothetical protein